MANLDFTSEDRIVVEDDGSIDIDAEWDTVTAVYGPAEIRLIKRQARTAERRSCIARTREAIRAKRAKMARRAQRKGMFTALLVSVGVVAPLAGVSVVAPMLAPALAAALWGTTGAGLITTLYLAKQ